MVLYALCDAFSVFSLHRESPDMILGDKPLIFEKVVSHWSCFATVSPPQAPVAVLRFPLIADPSCTMWIQVTYYAFAHAIEQDTLPIASLISKQAIPY
jgi:hypothetical protein